MESIPKQDSIQLSTKKEFALCEVIINFCILKFINLTAKKALKCSLLSWFCTVRFSLSRKHFDHSDWNSKAAAAFNLKVSKFSSNRENVQKTFIITGAHSSEWSLCSDEIHFDFLVKKRRLSIEKNGRFRGSWRALEKRERERTPLAGVLCARRTVYLNCRKQSKNHLNIAVHQKSFDQVDRQANSFSLFSLITRLGLLWQRRRSGGQCK